MKRETAGDMGIRSVTTQRRVVSILPPHSLKTTRERTVAVSLPRVSCLDDPADDRPPRDRRR
jgi:hypothetical protein